MIKKINKDVLHKINNCMKRIQLRDKAAISELYDLFNAKLRYISFSILHIKEEAEDLVQDFWTRIYDVCDKWFIKVYGYKFLVVSAKNFAIDRYRKIKKERDKNSYFDTLEYLESSINEMDFLEKTENHDLLEEAFKSLTETERKVWFEYYYGEKSIRAIAKTFEMSKSHVDRVFQEVKLKIKEKLKDMGQAEL